VTLSQEAAQGESRSLVNETEPLVSVVVPVFNTERYVRESLDSILGQTYTNLEVIVMDDASTDGASDILRAYDDPRLSYIRNERNLGLFANVNEGIRRATGELIAMHHSDDVYDPELLSKQVEFLLRNPEVGAVFAIDVLIDANGRERGRIKLPEELRGREILTYPTVLNGILRYQNVFLRGCQCLIPRRVYEDVGFFDDTYRLRADLDLWLRVSRRYSIGVIEEHLLSYRQGHDNESARYDRLRTKPELWFDVVDRVLAEGDAALAEPDALAAYEGHRAEDRLMVAVNQYILGKRKDARATLATSSALRIALTKRVQRGRLLVLWCALQVLVRLPRIPFIADAFMRRWHGGDR
jgi:GT2 family glycosyltransferase